MLRGFVLEMLYSTDTLSAHGLNAERDKAYWFPASVFNSELGSESNVGNKKWLFSKRILHSLYCNVCCILHNKEERVGKQTKLSQTKTKAVIVLLISV